MRPTDLDGEKEKIIFKVVHSNPEAEIFWHLDKTYLSKTQSPHEIELAPEAGYHTITLVDTAYYGEVTGITPQNSTGDEDIVITGTVKGNVIQKRAGDVIVDGGKVTGVETTRGTIRAPKIGVVVAGNASVLAAMAGLRLPIESHPLQAFVSEPLKPVIDTVIMSNAVHGYISQSDKGELVIGAGIDAYNGYGQRGSFHTIEHTMQAIIELFPVFSRVRMLRQWGGIVDVCPDACPIISKTSSSLSDRLSTGSASIASPVASRFKRRVDIRELR